MKRGLATFNFLHFSLPPTPPSFIRRFSLFFSSLEFSTRPPARSQPSVKLGGAPWGRVKPGNLGGFVFFAPIGLKPAELVHEGLKKKVAQN